MQKEKFETNSLKSFYKHRFVCEKCGVAYGSDTDDREIYKKILCPFCRRLKWRLKHERRRKKENRKKL
jgi:DNA replicative helicase MCM subunit Mcm2 (Cdc46/Mcm family)